MKGLILKDIYMMAKYCRSFLFIFILFTVIGALYQENTFILLYPGLLVAMLPITLLSYDERSKWDVYSGTLPCSKKQIVSGKYIIGVIVHIIAVVFTLLAQIVSMVIKKNFDGEHLAFLACILISLPAISSAITLPLMFRFGTEKGRLVYFAMIGLFSAIAMIITLSLINDTSPVIRFSPPLVLLCVVSIILYALSWHLSVKFYEKREL